MCLVQCCVIRRRTFNRHTLCEAQYTLWQFPQNIALKFGRNYLLGASKYDEYAKFAIICQYAMINVHVTKEQ